MFCSSSINGFSLLDIKTENWTVVQRVVEGFRCFSMNKQQVWPDSTTFWTFSVSSFFYTHSKTDMWAVKWTSMFKHGVGVGPHVEPCGVGGFGSVPIMSDLTGVQSVLRCGGNIPDVDVFISPRVSHLAEHRRRNVAANQRCWQPEAVKINVRWGFLQQESRRCLWKVRNICCILFTATRY